MSAQSFQLIDCFRIAKLPSINRQHMLWPPTKTEQTALRYVIGYARSSSKQINPFRTIKMNLLAQRLRALPMVILALELFQGTDCNLARTGSLLDNGPKIGMKSSVRRPGGLAGSTRNVRQDRFNFYNARQSDPTPTITTIRRSTTTS